MSLNGSLEGLIDELKQIHETAEAVVADKRAQLAEAQAEVQRVRAMLKAAGAVAGERPKVKPHKQRAGVSDETRDLVLKAIWEHEQAGQPAVVGVPGSFAVSDLEGDFHETSARAAVYMLREQGFLRVVGKKPVGKARSPLAYARTIHEQ